MVNIKRLLTRPKRKSQDNRSPTPSKVSSPKVSRKLSHTLYEVLQELKVIKDSRKSAMNRLKIGRNNARLALMIMQKEMRDKMIEEHKHIYQCMHGTVATKDNRPPIEAKLKRKWRQEEEIFAKQWDDLFFLEKRALRALHVSLDEFIFMNVFPNVVTKFHLDRLYAKQHEALRMFDFKPIHGFLTEPYNTMKVSLEEAFDIAEGARVGQYGRRRSSTQNVVVKDYQRVQTERNTDESQLEEEQRRLVILERQKAKTAYKERQQVLQRATTKSLAKTTTGRV